MRADPISHSPRHRRWRIEVRVTAHRLVEDDEVECAVAKAAKPDQAEHDITKRGSGCEDRHARPRSRAACWRLSWHRGLGRTPDCPRGSRTHRGQHTAPPGSVRSPGHYPGPSGLTHGSVAATRHGAKKSDPGTWRRRAIPAHGEEDGPGTSANKRVAASGTADGTNGTAPGGPAPDCPAPGGPAPGGPAPGGPGRAVAGAATRPQP